MMPRHLLDKPWDLVAACIQAFVMVACLWAGPASANEDEKKVQGRLAYIGGDNVGDKEYPDASAACTAFLSSRDPPEGLKAASPPSEQGDVRCQGTGGFDMHLSVYRLLCPPNTRVESLNPHYHVCECDSGFVARGGTTCVAIEEATAEGSKGAAEEIEFTRSQLQHSFKHAEDFGVVGNANNKTLAEFSTAVQNHVTAPGTQVIQGTYRGQSVTHFVDPNTGLNVIRDASGNFLSGSVVVKLVVA